MSNPNRGEARRKLIDRINLLGTKVKQKSGIVVTELVADQLYKYARTTADAIESGTLKVADLKDKVSRRHANILDPENWEPCDGEAHTNPNIDGCGQCSPNWSKVWKSE